MLNVKGEVVLDVILCCGGVAVPLLFEGVKEEAWAATEARREFAIGLIPWRFPEPIMAFCIAAAACGLIPCLAAPGDTGAAAAEEEGRLAAPRPNIWSICGRRDCPNGVDRNSLGRSSHGGKNVECGCERFFCIGRTRKADKKLTGDPFRDLITRKEPNNVRCK